MFTHKFWWRPNKKFWVCHSVFGLKILCFVLIETYENLNNFGWIQELYVTSWHYDDYHCHQSFIIVIIVIFSLLLIYCIVLYYYHDCYWIIYSMKVCNSFKRSHVQSLRRFMKLVSFLLVDPGTVDEFMSRRGSIQNPHWRPASLALYPLPPTNG